MWRVCRQDHTVRAFHWNVSLCIFTATYVYYKHWTWEFVCVIIFYRLLASTMFKCISPEQYLIDIVKVSLMFLHLSLVFLHAPFHRSIVFVAACDSTGEDLNAIHTCTMRMWVSQLLPVTNPETKILCLS